MKSVGAAAKRRRREWADTVVAVFEREEQVCEACKRETAVDAHHCFGRSNQIPRHYADMPELVAAVCRPCHTEVTDHPRSYWANTLRWKAVRRFGLANPPPTQQTFWSLPAYWSSAGYTPLQAIREMIRQAEEKQAA